MSEYVVGSARPATKRGATYFDRDSSQAKQYLVVIFKRSYVVGIDELLIDHRVFPSMIE